ncbi:MAG: hypothetical protein P1U41_09975 [Vicingaceae bacterium]|nr:hypothetical protein [Vicingaceae bacterium]
MRKLPFIIVLVSIISSCSEPQNTHNISEDSIDYTELKDQLDSIYQNDQKYRLELDELESKYSWDSDEVQAQWELIHLKDSLNLIQVEKIINQYGWLGEKEIGSKGNSTLFLVIQHAPIESQKKYLPIMRTAAMNGDAIPSDLALLEDRVAMRNGNKQIYGSQILFDEESGQPYVYPIIEPDSVNIRRAKVGLGTIEEYAQIFEIVWDLNEHKKRIKAFDSIK